MKRAVIDSSPLLNLLALHFVRVFEGSRHDLDRMITGNAENYLRNNSHNQQRFLALFDEMDQLVVSSHVVGELQGLSRALKLDGPSQRRFWEHSVRYLRERDLDESLVRLLDLDESIDDRPWIGIIGPTDTGLIRLAYVEECPLLTDDEKTLYRRALALGIRCELVRNLVEGRE